MMIEKAATINCVWLFPYYCCRQDLLNKWGVLCADLLNNTDTDLPLKYQDRVVGCGVQIMAYLIKTLPKECQLVM